MNYGPLIYYNNPYYNYGRKRSEIELIDVHSIIKLKKEGYSNRAISNILHINRKTIAKHWNEYSAAQDKLKTANKTEVLHIQAKIYFDKIVVFSNLAYVCEHKKIDGVNEISIDIHHYLNTFTKKPGALRNSEALKSIPLLKSIYDSHFIKNPKKFIELLKENNDKDLNSLLEILNGYTLTKNKIIEFKNLKDRAELGKITRNQITMYNHICIGGEKMTINEMALELKLPNIKSNYQHIIDEARHTKIDYEEFLKIY